jgi:nucleoside-diphosphate-sugar epimerase
VSTEKILITGGCGFVGRHLTSALVRQGHAVTVVDPLTDGGGGLAPKDWGDTAAEVAGEVDWKEQDCREYFANNDTERVDTIYHLAAVVGGRLTIERQALAVAQDLAIDAAMFEWASRAVPGRIVYFSSSAAYPISLQTRESHRPLSESDIDFSESIGVPDLSYGWSKLTGEFLSRLAAERYGLKVACFRPFSGYGPDQDPAYPFPAIVDRVLGHKAGDDFVVWGSGLQERDFIHIDDCIRGILEMSPLVDDGSAVNLSTGSPTTFRDLATLIASVADVELRSVRPDLSKPEGVFSRVGATELQEKLGFRPSIGLRDGVLEAITSRSARGEGRIS